MNIRELARIFIAERELFLSWYPARMCARASLSMIDGPCPLPPCAPRDYACADLSTGEITVSRRILDRPAASVRALLRHELGHLADPRPQARNAEARADRIAQQVGGVPIRYGADLVQTLDPAAPFARRPRSLPR